MIILIAALIVALWACAFKASKSDKPMAHDVMLLTAGLVLPVLGNLLIIASGDWLISYIGCYVYYIGLDFALFALMVFSCDYCGIEFRGTIRQYVAIAFVVIDVVQLLLNMVFGHAFTIAPIMVDGSPYYAMTPLLGQAFHRIVAYGMFVVSIFIFVYKSIRASRITSERYVVVLAVMVAVGLWQTFYIFSRTPIDRSMIGFGVFGLLIFYFALYYKPVRLLDRMLARVVASLDEIVVFFDADDECIYANDAARKAFGFEDDDLQHAAETIEKVIGSSLALNIEWDAKRHLKGADGQDLYWLVSCRSITDARGRTDGTVLDIRDVTKDEIKLIRERHLATHDRLTGLFNKEYLYDSVRQAIDDNPSTRYCVVGLDIKDFKIVNDIFNKEYGDQLLQSIAQVLRDTSVPGEVYGRITGDKFGFLAPTDDFDPAVVETALRAVHAAPQQRNHPIVIHMGIYDVDDLDAPVSVMFDRAFMAIASIKNEYQKHVAYYDKGMRDDAIWTQQISAQLDDAIADGQVRPYLQPMVDSDGRVEGAEVLVRWIHPEEGFLSPARFIPVFEANGMIAKLDQHMWECACRLLKDWQDRGVDLFLSVNISPKDFYFIDVYGTIRDLVDRYGVDPAKLRLEITETVMMSDIDNRLKIIEDLRSYGFMVEMDDFGSGYSSLNMLKDMPVDVLKIDMMFLYKTKDQGRARTILQTIINLSSQLGILSVTEGVETADQLDMLVDMGCRLFQGYHFAKPMPVEDFEDTYAKAA